MSEAAENTSRYKAFISYARADDRIAAWLHGRLERFVTPPDLRSLSGLHGPVPASLRTIFRDRTDLSGGGALNDKLTQALQDSQFLIVLCSPAAAQSFYVNQEVETFLALGRRDHVFPVVTSGAPDSGDPATECFPPALRGLGLLAADLRDIRLKTGQLIGDGREDGCLKLIAGILGVELDVIRRRERQAQRRRMMWTSVAASVFLGLAVAAAGLGVLAYANGQKAQITLDRYFAVNGWAQLKDGRTLAAARYALAGRVVAPQNEAYYRNTLAGTVFETGDTLPPLAHGDTIYAVAYSADGAKVVTASADKTAVIWDAHTSRRLVTLDCGSVVNGAVFSPDGKRVVTASHDKTAAIWDAATGKRLAILTGHTGGVGSPHFSPDGTRIVTAGGDGTAIVWDAATGRLLFRLSGHHDGLTSTAFSPDGTRIVTASDDGTARVWNAADGSEYGAVGLKGGGLTTAVFSPDSAWVVTAGDRQDAALWDVRTGRLIGRLTDHGETINSAAFSPDGTRLVTGGDDNDAQVWDLRTGKRMLILSGHSGAVVRVAFSNDGSRILTASGDHTAKIWDGATGALIRTLSGHEAPLNDAAFAPDGRQVVTASADGTARLWPLSDRGVVTLDDDKGAVDAALSPDGTRAVTGHLDTARIWDAHSGKPVLDLKPPVGSPPSGPVLSASFTRDGSQVLTGRWGNAVQLWDARSGALVRTYSGYASPVMSAQISPDGTQLLTANAETAEIRDLRSGKLVRRLSVPPDGEGFPFVNAAYAPDGTKIVTAGLTMTRIWDVRSGKVVASVSLGDDMKGVMTSSARFVAPDFAPDGRSFAVPDGRAVKVSDALTGKLLLRLSGSTSQIVSARFSPDGLRLATASEDGTLSIWDARSGERLASYHGASLRFNALRFAADGQSVIAAGGTTTIWAIGPVTRSWTVTARDACINLLGPKGRRFTPAEIAGDPLLQSQWRDAERDVCRGVPGVAPLGHEARNR